MSAPAAATAAAKAARTRSAPRGGPDGFEPGSTVTRAAVFTPGTYDPQARTIEAVLLLRCPYPALGRVRGTRGLRRGRRSRARRPPAAWRSFSTHDQDRPIGVVEDARFEADRLVGRLRFSDTEDGRAFEGQVSRGELSSISIGYRVTTWTLTSVEEDTEIWRAERWELLEVSLVTVPADALAAVRSAPSATPPSPRADAQTEEATCIRRNSPQSGTAPVDTAPAATQVETPRRPRPPRPPSPPLPRRSMPRPFSVPT